MFDSRLGNRYYISSNFTVVNVSLQPTGLPREQPKGTESIQALQLIVSTNYLVGVVFCLLNTIFEV